MAKWPLPVSPRGPGPVLLSCLRDETVRPVERTVCKIDKLLLVSSDITDSVASSAVASVSASVATCHQYIDTADSCTGRVELPTC